MKTWVIGIIAVVIIGGGGYLALHNNSNKTDNEKSDSSSQSGDDKSGSSQPNASDNQQAAATITYSDSGFSPSPVTVKSGDTVAIKNASSQDLQFDSNPHPAHTDDEELNVGTVASGQTVTFKVTKTGTYGFHNHFNPGDTGTIVVQ